jgi:hypothetical protein
MELILSDKNFDIAELEKILSSMDIEWSEFIKNYGVIKKSDNIEYLYELHKKFKKSFIKTAIVKSEVQNKIDFELINEFKNENILSEIKLLSLFPIKENVKHINPFREFKANDINLYLKEDVFFCLDIFSQDKRYIIDANNFNYVFLKDKSLSTLENLKKTVDFIKNKAGGFITNLTLDLFMKNKNIEYFIYEDFYCTFNEIKWLKRIYL